MSDKPDSLEARMRALNALADAQRAKLLSSLHATRSHAHPARLKQRVGKRLLDRMLDAIAKGRASIIAHPARALGIAAVAGAVLARGPLVKLAAKAYAAGKAIAVEKYRQHRIAKGSDHRDG